MFTADLLFPFPHSSKAAGKALLASKRRWRFLKTTTLLGTSLRKGYQPSVQ